MDHKEDIAELQQSLNRTPDFNDAYACGVDVTGCRHDDEEKCENYYYDEFDEGCRVADYARWEQKIRFLKYMPAMVNHYWQIGVAGNGLLFLERNNFVLSYE